MAHRPDDGRRTKATSERNSDPRDHATPQAGANTKRSADATSSPQALTRSNYDFPCTARPELGLLEILQVREKSILLTLLYQEPAAVGKLGFEDVEGTMRVLSSSQILTYEQDVLGTTRLNMKRVFLPLVVFVLGGSCYAQPFRIVAYGDSITYGWVPNPNPPSTRYDFDDRWPGALQKALGSNYQVIEEGLDGRTTDAPDPGSPITGAQLDGSAYLQACLASHLPVDLVVIMLGTNDLKPVFNRTPLRIAIGAAHLIDLVNTLNGGVGTSYKNPKVLLICPPPLNPSIDGGPIFGPMFKGGVEKSNQLPELYEAVAKMGGSGFLNAGSVISTDGVDGLHLSAESERKLGIAIAAKVKEMLK